MYFASIETLESRSLFAVLGIDVSNFQGVINWTSVRNAGKEYAFVKATEGVTFNDARFVTNMTNGAAAGVLMGAYHFARPDNNAAVAEADHLLQIAGPYLLPGYLPPVLDIETAHPSGSAALRQWCIDFCARIVSQTGISPIVYANGSFITNLSTTPANALAQYPLWKANPTGNPNGSPGSTGQWSTWTFWQYSWTGSVAGISGDVDLDTYPGTRAQLETLLIQSPAEVSVTQNGGGAITDGQSTVINFGNVVQNSIPVSQSFTVSNTGSGSLTTSALTVPTGYTITNPLAATIAAGASDVFAVQLDTLVAGTKSGNISFTNSDSNESPFNFPVTGTVVPPDTIAPTASITPVSPDPRTLPASSITIVFSEHISGFDISDLTFSRNGSANLLTGSQTLTTSNGITYTLSGIASLTGVSGNFSLTINPSGSGIVDDNNNAMTASANEAFKVQMPLFRGDATGNVNDTYIVRRSASGTQLEIFENIPLGPTPTYVIVATLSQQLVFETNSGNDTLTIDYSNGEAAPFGARFINTVGSDMMNLSNAGTFIFSTDPSIDTADLTLNVNVGATAVFNATATHLSALNVAGTAILSAGSSRRIVTDQLSVSGILDLTDNDLIIDYSAPSPIDAVQTLIASARNGGEWNGTGITSSAAASANPAITTLGLLEASEYLAIYGTGTPFSGEPVDETAVLVKYTYYGDTDFSGTIDFDDYVKIDSGFNLASSGWSNGDSNGDGMIDFDDYVLLDTAFNLQAGVLYEDMFRYTLAG